MAKLFELKQLHTAALDKAESFLNASEGRALTTAESENMANAMSEARTIEQQIKAAEEINTLRAQMPNGRLIPGNADPSGHADGDSRVVLSKEYRRDFAAWARSRGKAVGSSMSLGLDAEGGFKFPARARASAAAYEGAGGSGSFILPVITEQSFVELAPPEMGVESIATVIPTSVPLTFPRKTAHGTASAKAESTTSTPTNFTGTDPLVDNFTLNAYMIGHPEDASWELLQDVNVFQSFMEQDILLSLAVLKEGWYVSGTGANQAQGLLGNTGVGITGVTATTEAESTLNNAILDATFDVLGTLNAIYHPNARFLMSRPTSIILRKAQKQANLFEPVFTRVGGQDYLHNYPVTYSTSMPSAVSGNTPVLFGDFKAGYIIGQRGGAGVNVKILDQPKALQGLLTVLGYQRIDGRVRRSEAIQAISLG
jgi:HK97 family phage major capsid protein